MGLTASDIVIDLRVLYAMFTHDMLQISDAAIDETVAVKGGYGTGKGEEA